MRASKTEISISLRAVDGLVREVITEGARPYEKLMEKLGNAKPGTRRHQDLLCELSVQANVVAVKAHEAESAIEEYLESLPDDDD